MDVLIYILAFLYIAFSVYNGHVMREKLDSIFFGVITFVISIIFTPVLVYFLTDFRNGRLGL